MAVGGGDFNGNGGGDWQGLVSVADNRDKRRGQGMIEGVWGEAWMQNFNVLPHAFAKNNGVQVGEGRRPC